jgi:N-acetyl-anhydromuramyl-L-alanine amidase AmpD
MRYPDALWRPSPNFSRGRPKSPKFVVIHITDGSPNVAQAASHFVMRGGLAPHFLIGQAGEVYQHVDTDDRAWHAKGWNTESIGIEHVARSPGELRDWAKLSTSLRLKLVPEGCAIDSDVDPGFPPTQRQLEASAHLVAWLCSAYEWEVNRQRIRAHCECPTTSHADCGRDWPWEPYLAMVRATAV